MRVAYKSELTRLIHGDCREWLAQQGENTIDAIVTDPPYGMLEYSKKELGKLRAGRGGVWRIPPSIGGSKRRPLPRFTVLGESELAALFEFFEAWGALILPVLKPGGHVVVATSPLFNHVVSQALESAGLEKRGEIVRLVRTLRGGDRPKGAEEEFREVSAMPRSAWEPWVLFRKQLDGTVAENLRRWKTGGLRRPSADVPFTDVVASGRTPREERAIAPHPSLKPQEFLRQVVRAVLPTGEGVILDPFAGSGSTLAACQAVGAEGIGIEIDREYVKVAVTAIPELAAIDAAVHSAIVVHMWDQDTPGGQATSASRNGVSRP